MCNNHKITETPTCSDPLASTFFFKVLFHLVDVFLIVNSCLQ